MDNNLFEILLAFYLIFTFIGGILKKKKKARRSLEASEAIENINVKEVKPAKIKRDEQTREMLNKIFGIQMPDDDEDGTEREIPNSIGEVRSEPEVETWHPEKDFEDVEENQVPVSISDPLAEKYKPEVKHDEFLPPLLSDKEMDEIYSMQSINESVQESKYHQMIHDVENLRDVFLLSEILNKPKALRKNG